MNDYLQKILSQAAEKIGISDEDLPEIKIEKPRDSSHGDAATNLAMTLAGVLRKKPRSIAEELVGKMEIDSNRIESVEIAGPGFINFRFSDAWIHSGLADVIEQGEDYGKSNSHKGQHILVEFVSANPTGPLTVGHGRNAVLGDTISRLLEWTGGRVDREYYFNNAGRQMRVLGQSVRARYLQKLNRAAELPEGGYEGEYIQSIADQLVTEFGEKLAEEADEKIFRERAEQEIFRDIQTTMERMGIRMDTFFNEHDLYEDGSIDNIVRTLRKKELVYDKDGAVWFRTTEYGKEKDTVLIKSSGEPTYRLPDIAYHCNKLERSYDRCIDVFGADHIDTYPDVLNGVKAVGYDPSKVDVLVYQFVTIVKDGKPYKMSTRKANFVTLDELMDEVGADVTRFFFLMRSPSTHLEFDIDRAKEDGEKNPVFYLQYAHARIRSILRKLDDETIEISSPDLKLLSHESEIQLIKSILDFPDVIHSAAESMEPHRVINFLNELASDFTSFYHNCRILSEEKQLMIARAALAERVAQVLKNGLTILGIEAPERM
ncbi:MAG: arginine--tRNA ligase [Balneolaceae bacterium]